MVSEEDLRKALVSWEEHIRNRMWGSNLDCWKDQDKKCNDLWGLLNEP